MSKEYERIERFVMEDEIPVEVHEEINVSVPINVQADVDVGRVRVKCKGCPILRHGSHCNGRPNAISRFTVSQRLEVDIPLEFEAEVEVGEGHIDFDVLESDCNCRDCDDCDNARRDCNC